MIPLPLRSLLYVRKVDVPNLIEKYGWEFRTKHELGVELLRWFVPTMGSFGVQVDVWLVADGAYPETVAARWAIEEHFHDVKEVWGAGQQQVRNLYSSIGCWNLNGWMYTLVELCCWDEDKSVLTDRTDRPWDNPDRRPSHADRRRSIMLQKQFFAALPYAPQRQKLRSLFNDMLALAT